MVVGPLVVQRELRLRGQRIPILFMTAIMKHAVRSRLLGQGASRIPVQAIHQRRSARSVENRSGRI